MRVFFACHRLPYPPKRGGKIRPFNIIKHLTESGHRVTVASIARSNEEFEEGLPLKDYCEDLYIGRVGSVGPVVKMFARLPTPGPSSMGYFSCRKLHRQLKRVDNGASFDLAFVHCSTAAQYAVTRRATRSIIDFGDMDSQKWRDYGSFKPFPLSLGYRLEAGKLEREERRLARVFDLSTCTTRAELDTLDGFGVAHATGWFPNGVDTEYFTPTGDAYEKDTICFIGRMDYYPNQQAMLWFCDHVFDLVRERRPGTRLIIVGAEPSLQIRELGKRNGISVTGTVPDVRDYVRGSALSIAPLIIARGTQNKILESMAMGVPVVASELAAKGVDAVPGVHLLTASSPAEYADAILALLSDPERRRRFAEAGRNRVETNHNWSSSMQSLDMIISRVMENAA